MIKNKNNLIQLKPFVKWVGSKSRISDLLANKIKQSKYNTYSELFVGSGAVFLSLRPKKAILTDLNAHLIITWKTIKNDITNLLNHLKQMKNTFDNLPNLASKKNYYLLIRRSFNAFDVEISNESVNLLIAAYFIFLNKTGFNGLYRVNKQGVFNVAFGKYQTFNYDAENLLNIANFLNNGDYVFMNISFENALKALTQKTTFLFIDPPYLNFVNKTFVGYQKQGFKQSQTLYLVNYLQTTNKPFLMTNFDSQSLRSYFVADTFKLENITLTHKIKCIDKPNRINELIIWKR